MNGKTRISPLSSKLTKLAFGEAKKKVNPLDQAIIEGRQLPSKNKKPERYLDK
jgi:hypothetical protein